MASTYKPKGKGVKWLVLKGIAGLIDVAQIIIDLTGIGVIVSEILEVITPIIIIGFFVMFRIPLFTRVKRIAILVGGDVLDAVTGGAAPFWILDVITLHSDVKKEDAEMMEASLEDSEGDPLNQDQVREPSEQNDTPLNVDGVRLPESRQKKKGRPEELPITA